ncbi:ribonuclease BN (tRNA processing enzyme) [Thermovibrio guaymasensis]|uniref:Ribonuclease BN (tRNA processing enzyme) n=1 Tax=Thermovibrio guaymasensis TaxID=240167 RepID=A0A420W8F4_9BACT|nr:MBL fold metallo-hydrolase [Thermovibrio guaymasensis]RKQ63589.1 ribonuclease BN (tRNA processing enzyme) [Thermovibrio guaymasensis]
MKLNKDSLRGKLVFLGTAGARYVAFGFLRQAGGLYFGFDEAFAHVDPGPGAFVHAHRKGIESYWTEIVILSHRHLDHCADVNHVLESMTLGGKNKRGTLLCPSDAVEEDPVVLEFTRKNVKEVRIIGEGSSFEFPSFKVTFPIKHRHGVETYGMRFSYEGLEVSYISDTAFFEELVKAYSNSDLLILNTTMLKRNPLIDHLSAQDSEVLIGEIKPRLAILTHFGRTMLSAKPWEVALDISKRTGVKTIAAYDNMIVDLLSLSVVRQR